jgi:hypothetical protein
VTLEVIAAVAAVAVFAVLFSGGVVVLAFGATQWSRAISAAVQARAHGNEADSAAVTMREATDALRESEPLRRAAPQPISDADLRAAQRYQRYAEEEEPATVDNGPIERNPFEGGMFAEPVETQ